MDKVSEGVVARADAETRQLTSTRQLKRSVLPSRGRSKEELCLRVWALAQQ